MTRPGRETVRKSPTTTGSNEDTLGPTRLRRKTPKYNTLITTGTVLVLVVTPDSGVSPILVSVCGIFGSLRPRTFPGGLTTQ